MTYSHQSYAPNASSSAPADTCQGSISLPTYDFSGITQLHLTNELSVEMN